VSSWTKYSAAVAVSLVLITTLTCCGCGSTRPDSGEEYVPVESDSTAEPDTAAAGVVTMNGRSVMGMWFEHWGYDWEGPVREGGYALDYRELDGDLSNIASSFGDNVSGLAPGSVVFFKLCFADFYGDNLEQLEGIIDEVIETAREKGLRLIIGNALPMRGEGAPGGVVSEYAAYNAFLEGKKGDGVRVYDFYGVLADEDGYLKPEYDTGDSHLNENAYSDLDETFFELLDQVYREPSPGRT